MNELIKEAAGGDLSGRYLTFYVGDIIYGIELSHVLEIIQMQPITGIPAVPYYIKGVINLRGKIVPVIDIRRKLGIEEIEYGSRTCIIVVTIQEMQVGLIVDSVSEVITVDTEQFTAPPEFGIGSAERYLSGISRINNRVVLNLDCNKFFASDLNTMGVL